MNIEEALLVLDTALKQKFLNDIQELVFRQSWLGQTYLEMAETSGYNANYIKDVGYKLWKLLSKVFQEEVTKSNFRSVFRRQYINFKNATGASVEGVTLQEKPVNTSTLSDSVETKSLNIHKQNIGASVDQKQNDQQELVGKDINSSNQINRQIAIPKIVINTVVAAPLDAQNKKIDNNVLTVIPQPVKPQETTAKTHQSLKEAVDLLTSYECDPEINLLKQWIRDDRYRLVAVLASRDEVISR